MSEHTGGWIIGLGEVLWDMLPGGRQLGGAPANFAYHAHALGETAAVFSAVGRDELGWEILDRLHRLGVGTALIQVVPAAPTGTVDVELDAAGVPRFIIHSGVAWDRLRVTPGLLAAAGKARALCFGSLASREPLSRRAVCAALDAAPAAALRIFDINLRQHYYDAETVRTLVARTDLLKLNDEELPVLRGLLGLPGGDEETVARRLVESFRLRGLALTRGVRGSLLLAGDRVSRHPGIKVSVVDTVGAGDAFTAAVVVGMLRGFDLERTHDLASRLAAFVCTQAGATPAIPEELVRLAV